MLYLSKFLSKIKTDSLILKSPAIVLNLGITSSQIKDLKKYALKNQLITQVKQEYFLTDKAEAFLANNPLKQNFSKDFSTQLVINVEYLKEEKAPTVLTRAIRLLAKHLIENQPIKDFSLEHALLIDIKNNEIFVNKIEKEFLSEKKISLDSLFEKYKEKGLSKHLIAIFILAILVKNIDKLAIYEKSQFQLNFDCLMFDRMIACPQNFMLQKTELTDEYILKDVSKIILNKTSNNILEITKGLYKIIKKLDKYTMKTENLSKKTLKLRNVILNAKDPITLFIRDIPKALSNKTLQNCDREFLNNLKISLDELKNCTNNLVKDIKKIIFKEFQAKTKEELTERFLAIKEFLNEKELKVLSNCMIEINISDDLWVNRIATFINKSRVPKDWSDEDYADFKVKTKEFALKLFILESTVGTRECVTGKEYHKVLNSFLNLPKYEQLTFLRKIFS